MTFRSRLLPMVAVLALVAAACADDDALMGDPEDGVAEVDEDAVDDDALEDDVLEDDAAEDEAAEDAAAEPDDAADGPDAAVGVVTSGIEVADSDLGAHLVTAEGMTTYAAVDQLEGEVVCVADCAQVWQPVLVDGEPDVAADVDAEVTTIERPDGGTQLVVEGAPLHAFVVDAEPGDVRGQGSADRWFVVSPTGALLGVADDD
ncbi:MAG: hypothetical protein EA340_04915 [Nitriliruptor sp.]|nr:MAG: hypothetical protein EA340_04915 [Nitriliruptor sp.]